jgi:two-component system, cell cycle sensor histidine kinase and response regulator CckA
MRASQVLDGDRGADLVGRFTPQRLEAAMGRPLRVLIVEDVDADAELVVRELTRGGFVVAFERVDTSESMAAALEQQTWDLIISDFRMPRFSATDALALCMARKVDAPIIVVSGTVGEEQAVEVMKGGACDFFLKGRLTRLGAAVDRALREAENRRSRRQAEIDRQHAVDALRESEDRYRRLIDNMEEVVYAGEFENDCAMGPLTFVSGQVREVTGHDPQDFLSDPGLLWRLIHPEDRGAVAAAARRVLAEGRAEQRRYRARNVLTGEYRWLEDTLVPQLPPEGGAKRFFGTARDITNRVRAEQELAAQQRFLRQIIDQNPSLIFVKDAEGRFTLANQAIADAFGATVADLIGKTDSDFNPNAEQVRAFRRDDLEVIESQREKVIAEECLTDARGDLRWFSAVKRPLIGPDGRAGQVLGVSTDITERKRAEEALRQAQERYVRASEIAKVGVWDWDLGTNELYVDPMLKELLGFADDEIPNHADEWAKRIHPDDSEEVRALARAHLDGETRQFEVEHRLLHQDGSIRWFLARGRAIRDATGTPSRVVGTYMDVSDRRRLEEQFRQSQKLEAVGRLAGGVAHDFNNMLAVITGYGELVRGRLGDEHPERRRLDEILKAAERAAGLTRQLLAFSRRQVLQPRVVDLNEVLGGIEAMLRRLIGEDVDLRIVPGAGVRRVKADPGQLEQLIMNLAVNARDAMPRGGRLIIETGEVELDDTYCRSHADGRPGPHVMLAVSDTGHGMDQQTQARIFEPFFTTKEHGKGTGLGLSTVHGIARQSGGHVTVYSELDRGTTFKVYLPVTLAEADNARREVTVGRATLRGSETLLLVEDDAALRDLVHEVLKNAGYTVQEAAGLEEAEAILTTGGLDVALVLTDVIMPGGSGREVGERLGRLRPGIKLLYMSGYTSEALGHHGVLEPGVHLLEKPFTAERLLATLRAALDASRPE